MLVFWEGFVCGVLVLSGVATLLAIWVDDREERAEEERRRAEEELGQRLR